MRYKSLLILCSLFLISCDQVTESSASEKETAEIATEAKLVNETTSDNICKEIFQKHNEGTLSDIMINPYHVSKGEVFSVDFDNDGIEEQLKYFPARTRAYLGEVIDGERRGFPGTEVRTVFYTESVVVKINKQFFVLDMSRDGPLAVRRLQEMTPEEFQKMDTRLEPPLYNIEVMCQYYED